MGVGKAITLCGLAGFLTMSACAKKPAPVVEKVPPPAGFHGPAKVSDGARRRLSLTGRVVSVDLKTRMLALRGPGGHVKTVHVDEAVTALTEVKKGDRVRITYHRAAEVSVRKVDHPRANPAPVAGRLHLVVTAPIATINRKERTVTLKREGSPMTIDVEDLSHFDKLKVGDLVELTYIPPIVSALIPAPMPPNP